MNKTFEELLAINVNDKTDTKGKFTYLSWAWAWEQFKRAYPEATYKVKKFGDSNTPYLKTESGFMVFTEVTAGDITYEMWLPVMDFRNQAKMDADMMDINKTIMRCLVKNLAMFGLGLYIYAGEDLPTEDKKSIALRLVEKYGKESVQLAMKDIGKTTSADCSLEDLKKIEKILENKE